MSSNGNDGRCWKEALTGKGGMYFVTKNVVPPEHVALWAWLIGWSNFLGQTAGVTSVAYTVSQMMLATASMNSGLRDSVYSYSP